MQIFFRFRMENISPQFNCLQVLTSPFAPMGTWAFMLTSTFVFLGLYTQGICSMRVETPALFLVLFFRSPFD